MEEMTKQQAQQLAAQVANTASFNVTSQEARKYNASTAISPLKELVYAVTSHLRRKFGPDMDFIHGEKEEQLVEFRATAKTLVAKGELTEINDVDSDIYIWANLTHTYRFQVFKGAQRRTSQIIGQPKEQFGFRDAEAELRARIDEHEMLYGSNKMPILRPSFIAGQKGEVGVRVIRRNSSVQLSTQFAGFILRELTEKKKGLTRSMNMLNEFVELQERLEISEEEFELLKQDVELLLTHTRNGMETIRKFKLAIQPRAIALLGLKTVHNLPELKIRLKQMRAAGEFVDMSALNNHFAPIAGQLVWDNPMTTTGMQGAALRQAMTVLEADRLSDLNTTYSAELKAELRLAGEKYSDNGMLKLAVVGYVTQYSMDKEGLSGLSMFWDTFEEGLLTALSAMSEDGELPQYKASPTPLPFFFLPAMGDSASLVAAHAELAEMDILKNGIEVVTIDGEVGIDLKAGFFPLEKQAKKVKWLPAGRDYVAKVTRYKGFTPSGISLQLAEITPIEEPEQEVIETIEETVEETPTEESFDGFDGNEGFDWEQEAPDALEEFYVSDTEEAFEEVVEEVAAPVVLVPTQIILETLTQNPPSALLTQQYEMKTSPLGTQIFMIHNGQRILSFSTDVQLSSLDGMRHDGTNFVV